MDVSPETTSGGNALKFYASQRIDIRRAATIKDSKTGEAIANRTKVKFVKNKVAPPYRVAEVDMRFGIGIDLVAETLDLATEHGLVIKSGAWFSWPDADESFAQGRESAITYLRERPELFEKLRSDVRQIVFPPIVTQEIDDTDEVVIEES